MADRPPYAAYASIFGAFLGGLAATSGLSRVLGRVLTWTLCAAAINDWLQAGFAALTAKASELHDQRA